MDRHRIHYDRLGRRSFLRSATLSLCGFPFIRAASAANALVNTVAAPRRALSQVDGYNLVLGTQTFDPSYRFTSKPWLLETAEGIRELGCSVIKFNLDWDKNRKARLPSARSLVDLVKQDSVLQQVLHMPFADYLLWAYPLNRQSSNGSIDEEILELSCFLLENFSGTGKRFYLGHWEGDWELRGKAGSREDPKPEAISKKINWLSGRQAAVDRARRSTAHESVNVFCYAEVNLVQDGMKGRPTMTTAVLPEVSVDFVSYSSYDTTNSNVQQLPAVLDFIESHLKPKPEILGKRVWVGEYGFPSEHHSPAEQDRRSREVIRKGLEWGCPFVVYWEFYNNEVSSGKQRGFWMVDDKGTKQPVYDAHRSLLQAGREFVARRVKATRRPPTAGEYRTAVLQQMVSGISG